MIRRTALFTVAILLGIGIVHVFAQGKEKKTVDSSNTNVVVIADADSIGDSSTATRYFLFPEFYSYWPIEKDDTVIKYQCYDAENSFINIDTIHNIEDVQHILFIKTFTNYLHTYIDADGKPKPSTASKTIYRYDKTDDNTWKSFDVANSYTSELKEFKNEIVRTDTTTIINPVNNSKQLTIRKYYKVVEQKKQGEIEQEK
jgi:hypothetical protein